MNLAQEIINQNILALAKGITLLESNLKTDIQKAEKLIKKCQPYSGNSIRLGITGIPGVGKSTFIETFGGLLTELGNKVAVLAIDPTSQTTRGSILGDKSRMKKLAVNNHAFIRPSPNRGILGGITDKTRESIILCEAAGFNIIIIETVGVGQNEINVKNIVDFLLLLMLPNAGDDLQGIKRGIMEIADLIMINKADGELLNDAKKTCRTYQNSASILLNKKEWKTNVEICSSLKNTGIDFVWKEIERYIRKMKKNGFFQKNRDNQENVWLHQKIKEEIGNIKYNELIDNGNIKEIEKKITNKKINIHDLIRNII